MRLKNVVKIISLLLTLLSITSCNKICGNTNNLRINFKSNKLSDRGYAAAIYNDRIYYISNENGDSGIYSMNNNGTDIIFEGKNPSITGIQLKDNHLYFIGLNSLHNTESTWPSFSASEHTVYSKYLKGENNKINKVSLAPEHFNIKNFYFSHNGYVIFETGTLEGETYIKDLANSRSNIYSSSATSEKLNYPNIGDISNDDGVSRNLYFYQLGEILIITRPYVSEYKSDNKVNEIWNSDRVNIIDNSANEHIIKNNIPTERNFIDDFQILCVDDNHIYCTYNDKYENKEIDFQDNVQFNIINKNNLKIENSFYLEEISQNEKISHTVEYNGDLYMIIDEWSSREYERMPIKKEKLIAMNKHTYDCKIITEMNNGARIIGLTADNIIYFKNKELFKAKLENYQVKNSEKILDMSVNLNNGDYTIDYAGDWMFIYKIYGGFTYASVGNNPGQQLLYKINLKTGKVVENTFPIDFSQLDPYREENKRS